MRRAASRSDIGRSSILPALFEGSNHRRTAPLIFPCNSLFTGDQFPVMRTKIPCSVL
jgi:hypothetical protein